MKPAAKIKIRPTRRQILTALNTMPLLSPLGFANSQMSIRAKGPLGIIYPWSENPKLQSETHYGRSIWQLRSLLIQ